KAVKEGISLSNDDGNKPVGIAALVDRSGGALDFGPIKHESLIKMNFPVYEPDKCPLCKEGLPLVKPGSRPQ
ncbi:MAG: orotate phosphoribosyltransferase, partial [Candidatus Omnitrophica bacterium]|nr:orotate phosphoribosyltransferase [Candidatus Omnitrophota bacterium]